MMLKNCGKFKEAEDEKEEQKYLKFIIRFYI